MSYHQLPEYTFRNNRIFPADWLEDKPYHQADSVDRYYVDLANKVAAVIKTKEVSNLFDGNIHDLLRAAMVLTEWFEDICSGTNVWRTVNNECKKRYGSHLPFYDVSVDYYEGEVNVADVQFLLWDFFQTLHYEEGRIINPENPAIEELAEALFFLFDGEFETAPANEKLADFVHSPIASQNIWVARALMHWFTYSCYVNHRNVDVYHNDFAKSDGFDEKPSAKSYYLITDITLSSKRNILSLNTTHWLSRMRDDDRVFEELYSGRESFCKIKRVEGTDLIAEDMLDECEKVIDLNSFEAVDRNYVPGEIMVGPLLKMNGKYNLAGMTMWSNGSPVVRKKIEERMFELQTKNDPSNFLYEKFLKASKGKSLVFLNGNSEMENFLLKKMGLGENIPKLVCHSKIYSDFILAAAPKMGMTFSCSDVAKCVAHPDNKFYDKDFAHRNSLMIIASDDVVDYSVACALLDANCLPDAYINSINGEEYGRQFVRRNCQFMADYFHHCSREYDCVSLIGKVL